MVGYAADDIDSGEEEGEEWMNTMIGRLQKDMVDADKFDPEAEKRALMRDMLRREEDDANEDDDADDDELADTDLMDFDASIEQPEDADAEKPQDMDAVEDWSEDWAELDDEKTDWKEFVESAKEDNDWPQEWYDRDFSEELGMPVENSTPIRTPPQNRAEEDKWTEADQTKAEQLLAEMKREADPDAPEDWSKEWDALDTDAMEAEEEDTARRVAHPRPRGGDRVVRPLKLPPPDFVSKAYRAWYDRSREKPIFGDVCAMLMPLAHGPAPPLADLKPISLEEVVMSGNFIHGGRALFVTTVELPGLFLEGVHLLVEDSEGHRARLLLFHAVQDETPPQELFPPGTQLALLEPYLTEARDKLPLLRCDNPQSVVRFRSAQEFKLAAQGKGGDPAKWEKAVSPEALAERADALKTQEKYAAAIGAYTEALDSLVAEGAAGNPVLHCRLRESLADCYLRTGRWGPARAEAQAVLDVAPDNLAMRCCVANALLGQQQLAQAHPRIEALVRQHPEDPTVKALQQMLADATTEQRTGKYDLPELMREAVASGGPLSVAHVDHRSPDVEFGIPTATGRGVRATRPIAEHQLVSSSRAVVIAQWAEQIAGSQQEQIMAERALSSLVGKIVSWMLGDPARAAQVYALDAGPDFENIPAPTDPAAIIDIRRILAICERNLLVSDGDPWEAEWARVRGDPSAPETVKGEIGTPVRSAPRTGAGLWPQEARFNHSCTPNCDTINVGDFLFVFATRPVAAGEELSLPYIASGDSFRSHPTRFRSWTHGLSFVCECDRCRRRRASRALQSLDAEVTEAYNRAIGAWVEFGMPLGRAAYGGTLSPERCDAIRSQLSREVPNEKDQYLLPLLLILEGAVAQHKGDDDQAVADWQRVSALRYAARGGGPAFERFADQCRVIGAMMACGGRHLERATQLLREMYAESCVPYGRPAESFKDLVIGLCAPWWKESPAMSSESKVELMSMRLNRILAEAVGEVEPSRPEDVELFLKDEKDGPQEVEVVEPAVPPQKINRKKAGAQGAEAELIDV